jgi:hypothetical protein
MTRKVGSIKPLQALKGAKPSKKKAPRVSNRARSKIRKSEYAKGFTRVVAGSKFWSK